MIGKSNLKTVFEEALKKEGFTVNKKTKKASETVYLLTREEIELEYKLPISSDLQVKEHVKKLKNEYTVLEQRRQAIEQLFNR